MKLFGSGLNLPQCPTLFKGTILTEFAVMIPVKILDNLASILVLDSAYMSVGVFCFVLFWFFNGISCSFEILYSDFWYLKYL